MTTADLDAPIRAFVDDVARVCDAHGQPCGLREVLFCIRDIPYGRPAAPRDPLSVLADWKGTCSGKHLLASRVLEFIGANARLLCQPYRLDDARDTLPRDVVQPYLGRGIWDVHNFLVVDTAARPLKVDLTWSRQLAGFGFPTTLVWDGASDFQIAAPQGHALTIDHPAELNDQKEALLQRLNSPAARALRERYIADLAAFATCHCPLRSREASMAGTLADIRERYRGAERKRD
ncbi:hypothetical protein LJR230_003428 [Trinickia sp. LjRoot230]|uniref:hypothetical protein n=1 Tax=Trinickia sp. LjRoot230 TaxID=3342288 RepID=UPI003ECFD830